MRVSLPMKELTKAKPIASMTVEELRERLDEARECRRKVSAILANPSLTGEKREKVRKDHEHCLVVEISIWKLWWKKLHGKEGK